MKTCPSCKKTYEDEANFCPEEACATDDGPRRLDLAGVGGGKSRFAPTDRLGGNRTGEVWKATDSQSGGQVVLKILDPSISNNPVTAGRVDRELKQLMRVENQHVVRVLDVGKMADGRMYLASELISGAETLATVLKRGAVGLAQAKQILAQIGEGLLEAQKAGLVHRDLAPKNILIDASGRVKLGNFAVAVPLDEKLSGVAEYASPEQAQGRPVDQRSNTYSLACIFYHLLTGEPPFAGADPRAIFELHASSLPLPPSQRRPEASLGSEVDRVILKALDKNSSKRPLTLRLFLNEVEMLATTSPSAAPGKADAGGVGFAKTMLFAGGQAEVQEMVQKAIAQRQAAQGGGTPPPVSFAPAPAPVVMAPAPAPAVLPTPAPVRIPQAADGSSAAAPRLTPPPVTPNPLQVQQAPAYAQTPAPVAKTAAPAAVSPPAAAAQAAAPGGGKGAAFRETLWFKKGDVEQMVADAKAKIAAAGGGAEKVAGVEAPEDIRPVEDRYVDDGSVTTDDRKNFSLRQGGTATALPAVGRSVPDEKMTEEDMAGELAPGRKFTVFIGIGIAVVVAIVVVALLLPGGKKEAAPALAPAAALAPVAAPAPVPAPSPPPPAAAAAAEPAAPAAAAAPEPVKPVAKARPSKFVPKKRPQKR